MWWLYWIYLGWTENWGLLVNCWLNCWWMWKSPRNISLESSIFWQICWYRLIIFRGSLVFNIYDWIWNEILNDNTLRFLLNVLVLLYVLFQFFWLISSYTYRTMALFYFLLKYGFWKKSLWKNATLNSWTLSSSQKGTCSNESWHLKKSCVLIHYYR